MWKLLPHLEVDMILWMTASNERIRARREMETNPITTTKFEQLEHQPENKEPYLWSLKCSKFLDWARTRAFYKLYAHTREGVAQNIVL